jgi:hypothetical protein
VQSTTAPPLRAMLLPSHLAPASGPPSPVPSRMSATSPMYRDGDGSGRLSMGDSGSEEISEVSAIRAATTADQQQQRQHPEITIAMAGAAATAAAGAGLAMQPSTVSTTSSNQGTSAVVVAPTESEKAYSRKPVVAIRLDSADSPSARHRPGRLSSGSAGGIGAAAAVGAAAADTAAEGEGGDTSKARRRGTTSTGGLAPLAGEQCL